MYRLVRMHNGTCTRTNVDTETENEVPETDLVSKFTSDKMQDGGGRHIQIHNLHEVRLRDRL